MIYFSFSVGELAVVKTGAIHSSLSKTVTLEFCQIDSAEVKRENIKHCRLTMNGGLESFYFYVCDDHIRQPTVASIANIAVQ